jgi:hypothetical protein
MIRLPLWFLRLIATLFVLSPAVIGTLELYRVGYTVSSTAAVLLYLFFGVSSVFYYRELKMPVALAIALTATSLIIPLLVNLNLDPSALGTPATWYVTAVATILAIAAVRQQRLWAWIGVAVLTLELLSWGGVQALFVSGLGGAIGLVAAAHAISVGLERSDRQRVEFLEKAKATQAASAADSAVRQERSQRLAATLEGVLPMLEKIASGNFSSDDQREATILEAELRDEIRGRMLINAKLKTAVRQARSRGVEVVVLDEGGLVATSEQERDSLRDRLAQELDQVNSGRVTIRSPQLSGVRATFVASRKGTAQPDVFLKL